MIMDFVFQCPTKIYFKNHGVSDIGKIIRNDYNFKRVYLIYGGNSLKNSGTYTKIITSLKEKAIDYKEYNGIKANPDIEDVIVMTKEVKDYRPDLILCAGGGSVLDAGKLVAHAFYYDGDPLDFNRHIAIPYHALPIGTIITIAASGSEMSSSCVISDRKHHFKCGFNSVTNYPLFSLLDPSLLYTVPKYQMGIGIADMFCHSFERFFTPSDVYEPSDGFALSIMKSIVAVSKVVFNNPNDESLRNLMLCSTLSHNGFTNFGKKKAFIVHKAEHILSGIYPNLSHGQGIALLMPMYLKINKEVYKEKILILGKQVFDYNGKSVNAVIKRMTDWLNTLPIVHSFTELDFQISSKDLNKAKKVLKVIIDKE